MPLPAHLFVQLASAKLAYDTRNRVKHTLVCLNRSPSCRSLSSEHQKSPCLNRCTAISASCFSCFDALDALDALL
ncbi:hypothetical protein B0H13DRAFT_2326339 [Mycena leptocephala]|nr:hypothetical protein B0H13DRAFT_2326339 [Mycena leptocephala]